MTATLTALIGSGQRVLVVFRRSNMSQVPAIGRAELGEVAPRHRQAQVPVRSAPHPVGVMVVLPVVLPETHIADLVAPSLTQSAAAAARAGIRAIALQEDIDKPSLIHGTKDATTAAREVTR